MRHFLLLTLIVALAVPTPLLGNVIVKRQAEEAETTPKPFGNDGFLEEGPLSPQELINTVGGLVRGVFQAFRRIAGTVRNTAEPVLEVLDEIGEVQARNPIISTLAEGQRRIDEDFREGVPVVDRIGAPFRAVQQTFMCDFICPTIGGQLLNLPCQIHDCPQVGPSLLESNVRRIIQNHGNRDDEEKEEEEERESESNSVASSTPASATPDIGAEFLGELGEELDSRSDELQEDDESV